MNSEIPDPIAVADYDLDSTIATPAFPPDSDSAIRKADVPAVKMTYSIYALFVLFLVNVLILMDRQILTVLAEDIKIAYRYSGFLEPWYINWFLFLLSLLHLTTCIIGGAWGLLVGNDYGILMEQCLATGVVGITPVYFS